jgi:uncharacterized protein
MTPGELLDFADRLRTAGVVVEQPRLAAAVEALLSMSSMPGRTPYWPLRLTLCGRRADLAAFDAVYHAWAAHGADEPEPLEIVSVDAAVAREESATAGDAPDATDPTEGAAGAASVTDLTGRDLRELSEAERAAVAELIARLVPAARQRRSTRWTPHRSGRVDAARTTRQMLRNGGEPVRLLRRRRGRRPRRLVFLVDVSRSMRVYDQNLLLFAHAAVVAAPTTAEVFVIGTRWTRVTAGLLARGPEAAMQALMSVQPDRGQGTTLGRSIESFLRRWSGHRIVRSAVVVIGSDGMEADLDQTRLPRQIERLSRIAHRIIWVNPSRRRATFKELGALRKSLRHVDDQLSGHSLRELRKLVEVIAR